MDEQIVTLYLELVAEAVKKSSLLLDSPDFPRDGLPRSVAFRDDLLSLIEIAVRGFENPLAFEQSSELQQLHEILRANLPLRDSCPY